MAKEMRYATYQAAPFVTPPANSMLLDIKGWLLAYTPARYLKALSSGDTAYLLLHSPCIYKGNALVTSEYAHAA